MACRRGFLPRLPAPGGDRPRPPDSRPAKFHEARRPRNEAALPPLRAPDWAYPDHELAAAHRSAAAASARRRGRLGRASAMTRTATRSERAPREQEGGGASVEGLEDERKAPSGRHGEPRNGSGCPQDRAEQAGPVSRQCSQDAALTGRGRRAEGEHQDTRTKAEFGGSPRGRRRGRPRRHRRADTACRPCKSSPPRASAPTITRCPASAPGAGPPLETSLMENTVRAGSVRNSV